MASAKSTGYVNRPKRRHVTLTFYSVDPTWRNTTCVVVEATSSKFQACLRFKLGENPESVAAQFVSEHNIPSKSKDKIVEAIRIALENKPALMDLHRKYTIKKKGIAFFADCCEPQPKLLFTDLVGESYKHKEENTGINAVPCHDDGSTALATSAYGISHKNEKKDGQRSPSDSDVSSLRDTCYSPLSTISSPLLGLSIDISPYLKERCFESCNLGSF